MYAPTDCNECTVFNPMFKYNKPVREYLIEPICKVIIIKMLYILILYMNAKQIILNILMWMK